jgi:hypothetical protein
MPTVRLRHEDIEQQRNPTDPLSLKPEVKGDRGNAAKPEARDAVKG